MTALDVASPTVQQAQSVWKLRWKRFRGHRTGMIALGSRTEILGVLGLVAASALVSALSINYTMLVVSRIIGGIAHGVFWSVVGAYAAYLVPKEHLGRAVSIVLGGGSLAFVLVIFAASSRVLRAAGTLQ